MSTKQSFAPDGQKLTQRENLPFEEAFVKFSFTIPLEPRSKKNSQNIVYVRGKPLIVQNKLYKAFEKECKGYITKRGKPIDFPCNVKCVFYRQTKRRVDLCNLLAAIDDILVKYGLFEDDCRDIIATHDGSVVLYDKESPRIEITVEQKPEYEQWKKRTEVYDETETIC